MEKWTNWNLKSLGFYSLLNDQELIEKIYRKECTTTFSKLVMWGFLYGGITFVLWFVFHGTQFYPLWIVMLLLTFYKLYKVFLHWYMNAILVTTENIVFVEWENFFKTRSSRIDYWNLDEIQVVRVGIRSFLSNYGDLFFMKAGGAELHSFKRVSRPNKTAREIEAYRESQVDAKNFTEESALKELISNLVQRHVGDQGQPERSNTKNQEPETKKEEKKETEKTKITKRFKPDSMPIEVEKQLDDEGGIELDLGEK
ncbi:hypothetical protein K9M59_04080 [Candidatus Gracilibacteria bacterium]|nr:hypothetical protein [Candidatus Gracilibacteria bacterium]MCF7819501.1 hypothetical protein [Candidatus Gracilibacteria bacterium]